MPDVDAQDYDEDYDDYDDVEYDDYSNWSFLHMNSLISIVDYSYDANSNQGKVTAIVEDIAIRYPQTHEDPVEMMPALCEANFILEGVEIPENPDSQIEFFQELNLLWNIVDVDDA